MLHTPKVHAPALSLAKKWQRARRGPKNKFLQPMRWGSMNPAKGPQVFYFLLVVGKGGCWKFFVPNVFSICSPTCSQQFLTYTHGFCTLLVHFVICKKFCDLAWNGIVLSIGLVWRATEWSVWGKSLFSYEKHHTIELWPSGPCEHCRWIWLPPHS